MGVGRDFQSRSPRKYIKFKKSLLAPNAGARYNGYMRIISRKVLREFWEHHSDAKEALQSWYSETKQAEWSSPAEIKAIYRSVSILPNNRTVFNIKGNHYRIIVAISYEFSVVYIRFVGTHAEYDKIDATTI